MSQAPLLADRILAIARVRLPALIKAVLDTGAQRLAFHAALASDKRSASDIRTAGATLYKLRRHVAQTFLGEMARALDGGLGGRGVSTAATLDICLDEHLSERLDGEHLRDAAELACRAQRVRFDALFSSACGQHVVNGEHVLRPEVHARCLALAMGEFPVRHAIRSAWFAFVGEALGHALDDFYAALSREMRNAGVREAEYLAPMVGGRRFEPWTQLTKPPASSPGRSARHA